MSLKEIACVMADLEHTFMGFVLRDKKSNRVSTLCRDWDKDFLAVASRAHNQNFLGAQQES